MSSEIFRNRIKCSTNAQNISRNHIDLQCNDIENKCEPNSEQIL